MKRLVVTVEGAVEGVVFIMLKDEIIGGSEGRRENRIFYSSKFFMFCVNLETKILSHPPCRITIRSFLST